MTDKSKPTHLLDDAELLQRTRRDWGNALNAARKMHKIFDYAELAYRGISFMQRLSGNEYYRSKYGLPVHVPRTFAIIESIRPNLSARPPRFVLKARNKASQGKEHFIQSILDNEWDRSSAKTHVGNAMFDAILYGTGFTKNCYWEQTGNYYFPKPSVNGKATRADDFEKLFHTMYKGVAARHLDPYDVFPDPNGNGLTWDETDRKCQFVYLRSIWRKDDFLQFFGKYLTPAKREAVMKAKSPIENYKSVRDIFDILFSMDAMRYPGSVDEYFRSLRSTYTTQQFYNPEEYIEVLERWEDDACVITAGTDTVLVKLPNPYPHKQIPIAVFKDYNMTHRFWGIGEAEAVRYPQVSENRIHNLAMDQIYNTISGKMGVISDYLEDETELDDANPSGYIHLKNYPESRSAFVPIPSEAPKAAMFNMLDRVKQIADGATGISDFLVGASQAMAGTATEANSLASAGNSRIYQKILNFEKTAVPRIAYHWMTTVPACYDNQMEIALSNTETKYVLDPHFRSQLSQKRIAKIIEKAISEGFEDVVFLDDLIGEFQIEVEGSSTMPISKQDQIRQWGEVLRTVNEVHKVTGFPVFDVPAIGKEMFANFEVVGDPSRFIVQQMTPDMRFGGMGPQGQISGQPVQTPAEMAMGEMQTEAQPMNQGINQIEG